MSKILVRNPKKRFDIKDIKAHRWLKILDSPGNRKKLPNPEMPIVTEQDNTINRPVLIYSAQMLGIDPRLLEKMVVEKDHNKYTTTYFLL
jgi:hypothetical protein